MGELTRNQHSGPVTTENQPNIPPAAHLQSSSAGVLEPLSDLSDDFVDLVRMQSGRFLFQLRTPCHQDLVRFVLLVTAFSNDFKDGPFPILKTHRLFLFAFDIAR
jgi:hypothetical protein